MNGRSQYTGCMNRSRQKSKHREVYSEGLEVTLGLSKVASFGQWLFGLYINKLEQWINKRGRVNIAKFTIQILLYGDDIVLVVTTVHTLQDHPQALENFCNEVGMDMIIVKMELVLLSLKKKTRSLQINFKGEPLETVKNYKCLNLEFNKS
jgi:hypothetical protein